MNSLGLLSANLIDALDALNVTSEQNRQAIFDMQTQSAEQLKVYQKLCGRHNKAV